MYTHVTLVTLRLKLTLGIIPSWLMSRSHPAALTQVPIPYDLLLASLASCKIITMQMYAQRKGWPVEGIEISMSTRKIHAKDCEDCESDPDARVDIIDTEIRLSGNLDQEQRERIIEISEKCPVHRTLTSETKIRTVLVD